MWEEELLNLWKHSQIRSLGMNSALQQTIIMELWLGKYENLTKQWELLQDSQEISKLLLLSS